MSAPTPTPTPLSLAGDPAALRAGIFGRVELLVVKIGSRLLAESPAGRPAAIADQLAALRASRPSLSTVIVSSGAISLGVRALGLAARPREMPHLQAAAAVGQHRLMQHWEHAFAAHDQTIAQVLLTHDDLGDRRRFLSARLALRALLEHQAVPIINENDTVATEEIRFGDNDLLSALVCNLVSADALIILTDVAGVLDGDGRRISLVRDVDREVAPLAGASRGDGVGSGGMASKVQSAKIATRNGVPVVVAPGRSPTVLADILAGADVGTLIVPSGANLSSRKHWIAYGARPAGRVLVDDGAHRALVEQKKSLLPRGVVAVEGSFDVGDTVSLVSPAGLEFGRGLAAYPSDDLRRIQGLHSAAIEPALGYKYVDEAVHRDDLVLL